MTRPYLALALVVGSGGALGASCSSDDSDSHPPYTSPSATGGSAGHGGRGSGGTHPGASGEGGHPGSSGAGAGGQSGEGATGGTSVLGSAGVPFSGDMGSLAGSGGGGGMTGPGDAMGNLFIGPGGFDAATGTRDNPFGTLQGAAAVAKSGNTIVYLPGNYTLPELDEAIVIPDGVDVVADVPRLVVLSGQGGTLLDLAGDTHIDGITFDGFATVVRAASDQGSVSVTQSTFGACPSDGRTSVFEVSGGANVALSGDAMHDWGACPAFAHVGGSGTFAVDGGVFHFTGASEPALFSADSNGKLELSNLTATDGNRPLLVLGDTAKAALDASSFSTLASNAVVLGDRASLDVTSTDLSLAAAASSPGACIQSNIDGKSALTLAHSLVHGCRAGIAGSTPHTLTLTDTVFFGMSESGLDLTTANGSTVTLDACSFHDDGARAARFGGGNPSVFDLSVRRTNLSSVPNGFELDGDATSTWDFGTAADPGVNVLTADSSALVLASADIAFVSAVGNTWTPDVQGADGAGHYAAAGPGSVLEVTSGGGQNYTDEHGATLRLAEQP